MVKPRRYMSLYQKEVLIDFYTDISRYPTKHQYDTLVSELEIDKIRIKTWFHNRRARERRPSKKKDDRVVIYVRAPPPIRGDTLVLRELARRATCAVKRLQSPGDVTARTKPGSRDTRSLIHYQPIEPNYQPIESWPERNKPLENQLEANEPHLINVLESLLSKGESRKRTVFAPALLPSERFDVIKNLPTCSFQNFLSNVWSEKLP